MIMVNDPPAPADEPTLFGGNALTYYGRWTYKFEEAARQGAAGALLIHTDASATYPWQVVQSSWSGTQYSLPPQAGRAGARHQGAGSPTPRRGTWRAAADAISTRCAPRPVKRGFKAGDAQHRAAATLTQKSVAKDVGERDRRAEGRPTPAEAVIYTRALGSLRHARAAADRQARHRPHL